MKTENINGFIWAVLDRQEATEKFLNNEPIYVLYDDGTEALIETYEDFGTFRYIDKKMGLEIGAKEDLESEYLETVERNKENRTFEEWCLSKIE